MLFSCKSDAGDCCVFYTLRASMAFLLVVPGTLVRVFVVFRSFGVFCTRRNCVTMCSNAFLTGSPASRLGAVVGGGFDKIETMS